MTTVTGRAVDSLAPQPASQRCLGIRSSFFDEIDRNGLLAPKAVSGTRLATVAYVMKHCRSRGIGGCRARNRYRAPRSVVGDGSQLADGTSDAWRSRRLADDMQVPATTAL